MAQTIIGPNSALRYLKAYDAHVDYWHEVNPAYLLAYVDKKDHTPYILEYAAEFQTSIVVARIYHKLDGGFHLPPEDKTIGHYIASPQNYHNDFGWLGQISNVILNVFNEPDGKADDETIQRLVDWMREYIPIAVQHGTKSVLFNWGVGQPRIFGGMMDARFGVVLELASLYPELFYMGYHIYGPTDTTESINAYLALCDNLKINPLRIIATEFANDSFKNGSIEAEWEISQVQHDLSQLIKSGVLAALIRFQEGNSGGWQTYDSENDIPYKTEIKRAALAGELEMQKRITQTLNPVAARDITYGEIYRIHAPGKIITAYMDKSISSKTMGFIPDNAVVQAGHTVMVDRETWQEVAYKPAFSGYAWIKIDLVDLRKTTEAPIIKVDTSTEVTKPLPALPDVPPSVETPPASMPLPENAPTPPVAPKMIIREKAIVDQLKIAHKAMGNVIDLMSGVDTRETIADIQHDIWSHWMRWVFKICPTNADGSVTIPAESANRWKRQVDTLYDELSESEKNSDREQADKVLKGIA